MNVFPPLTAEISLLVLGYFETHLPLLAITRIDGWTWDTDGWWGMGMGNVIHTHPTRYNKIKKIGAHCHSPDDKILGAFLSYRNLSDFLYIRIRILLSSHFFLSFHSPFTMARDSLFYRVSMALPYVGDFSFINGQ